MQSKVITGKHQATFHLFCCYYTEKIPKCLHLCVISDCMKHDTNTVHAFTCKVITYIKENLHAINKVYFSDGAASQYKISIIL